MPRSVSLRLEPGSNTVTLVLPGEYAIFLDDLVELLEPGLGPLEKAGSRGGLTFFTGGYARPVSMRVLPPTPGRLKWYTELGSPLGPDPQFVSLSIDWRGPAGTIIDWQSDIWTAPRGSIAVRGAPNWPDLRSTAEYRSWLGETATAEVLSNVATKVDNAVEGAKEAADKAANAFFWPLVIGGGVVMVGFLLWGKLGKDS